MRTRVGNIQALNLCVELFLLLIALRLIRTKQCFLSTGSGIYLASRLIGHFALHGNVLFLKLFKLHLTCEHVSNESKLLLYEITRPFNLDVLVVFVFVYDLSHFLLQCGQKLLKHNIIKALTHTIYLHNVIHLFVVVRLA